MRASHVTFLLLSIQGIAGATIAPQVAADANLVVREPIQDVGIGLNDIAVRNTDAEGYAATDDENGLEKRQAQLIWIFARPIISRIAREVIKTLIQREVNIVKRERFSSETVRRAGEELRASGRRGVTVCDISPGSVSQSNQWGPSVERFNVGGEIFQCFALPPGFVYAHAGANNGATWNFAPVDTHCSLRHDQAFWILSCN
ncbi:hypothetical protein J1614_006403 [Plenodomus biglobosus]|nr:hypothetical protein J1614_006403 [Plenodomus biglobosus]